MRVHSFQNHILSWYGNHKRDLPWRKTTDPYKILVSEIMLQQTQVDRVLPKYLAFLERFPTAASLAAAKTGDVISLWSGLGYNRRAVNLQRACALVVDGFPSTRDELLALPGIGPYASSAILSFAFNSDIAVVDTNIRRIFSRYFFSGAGDASRIDTMVEKALPQGKSRDWHNALMDFGSQVCTAKSPSCSACVLRKGCRAFGKGTQEKYFRVGGVQSTFEGSRRQYRGMVLRLLKEKDTATFGALCKHLSKESAFVKDIVSDLTKEELVCSDSRKAWLP